VTGELLDGRSIEGCDEIITSPICGQEYGAAFAALPLAWAHRSRRRRIR